jgi:drug/metabolite transporter (DMT)-like permease
VALLYTSAGDGALIQGAIPAVTVALSMILLGERLTGARVAGVAMSMAGLAFILLVGGSASPGRDSLLGNILMLTTVLSWAIYTVLGRHLRDVEPLAVTAYSTACGTLLLAVAALYEMSAQPLPAISWTGWLIVLYLGVICSVLGYVLWNWSLQHLDAGQAANFINLIPVVGVASGALVLGEPITSGQMLGGVLVLVGVWLAIR